MWTPRATQPCPLPLWALVASWFCERKRWIFLQQLWKPRESVVAPPEFMFAPILRKAFLMFEGCFGRSIKRRSNIKTFGF